jgi:hypothetical protein
MAITITWPTKVINVPRADMTLIQTTPYEIRQLDLNWFRLQLKALEDDCCGINYLKTHNHNTEVTLGGLVLARVITIISGYTITFEEGNYAVDIVGANSNVADVVNLNQVMVRSYNSAGLISVVSGSGLSTEEHDQLMQLESPPSQDLDDYKADVSLLSSISNLTDVISKLTGNKVTKVGDIITIYDNDNITPWRQYNLASGGRVQV